MSYYRQQLEDWLAALDVKANRVIDWGGKQGMVKDRVKSWQVKNYEVWDLPGEDIEQPITKSDKADIIFCLEVFEYLIDPNQAMANIYNNLLKYGKAYITFAFVYPHHNEMELEGLRYTEPAIRRLAEDNNLQIKNITYRIDKSGLLERFYHADGMHPAKQYAHHNVTGFIVEFVK